MNEQLELLSSYWKITISLVWNSSVSSLREMGLIYSCELLVEVTHVVGSIPTSHEVKIIQVAIHSTMPYKDYLLEKASLC